MEVKELEETKRALKTIRNKMIYYFRGQGVSIKALAYMFNLSEATIRQLVQGIEVQQEITVTREKLDNVVKQYRKALFDRGCKEADIDYIFGIEKPVESHTITRKSVESQNMVGAEEQLKYYRNLEFSYHTDIEKLKQKVQELDNANKSLVGEKAKLLEDANRANQVLQAKVNSLQSDIKALQSKLSSAANNLSQNQVKLTKLQSDLSNNKSLLTQEQATTRDLKEAVIAKNSEIKGLLGKVAKLESELSNKDSLLDDLRQQIIDKDIAIEEMTAIVMDTVTENSKLAETIQEAGNTRVVYTEKQRRRMRRVYKDCNYNRTEALKVLHTEGIMVSYKHLGRIVSGMKPNKSK